MSQDTSKYDCSSGDCECREVIEGLAEYLDGSLGKKQQTVLENHLAQCPQCRQYLESYQQCLELGKSCMECQESVLPGFFPEKLVSSILTARRQNCAPNAGHQDGERDESEVE